MAERKAFLRIHRQECLKCCSLVDFATEEFPECHFSAGNRNCPAQAVEILLHFDLSSTVDTLVAAKQAGDWTRLSSLMERVNQLPEHQHAAVMEALSQRERAGPSVSITGPATGRRAPVSGRS